MSPILKDPNYEKLLNDEGFTQGTKIRSEKIRINDSRFNHNFFYDEYRGENLEKYISASKDEKEDIKRMLINEGLNLLIQKNYQVFDIKTNNILYNNKNGVLTFRDYIRKTYTTGVLPIYLVEAQQEIYSCVPNNLGKDLKENLRKSFKQETYSEDMRIVELFIAYMEFSEGRKVRKIGKNKFNILKKEICELTNKWFDSCPFMLEEKQEFKKHYEKALTILEPNNYIESFFNI